ncbi:E3 ubiquitin-protein ligase APD2 isoform X2 [Arachis hypogaea]
MKTSSILVEKVEVRNDHNNLVLYAFNQKPELISQTNWTTSRFLVVPRNTRKGFSLWLNKGSRIRMRWEAQASSRNQLEGMVIKGYISDEISKCFFFLLIKRLILFLLFHVSFIVVIIGERRFEKMVPQQTFSLDTLAIRETINGNEAEYMIEEDDRYQIGVLNMNDKNIVLNLNVNVSAKIYDTTKANNIYSSINGSCTFSLLFPNTYYLILTAPKNVNDYDDDSNNDEEWFVEVSFITRVIAYIAILGLCIIVIFVILRCLGGYDNDNDNSNVTIDTSNNNNNVLVSSSQEITEPMMHHHHDVKPNPKNDEEEESSEDGSSCSSEELYDEKLCVICYDEQRNCFFVPCGHSATCFPCAKRIVDGESKVCPVCRRLIHKVRRLFMS